MSNKFKGAKIIKGTIFTDVEYEFIPDTIGAVLANHYNRTTKDGTVKSVSKLAYFTKAEMKELIKSASEVDYSESKIDLSKYDCYNSITNEVDKLHTADKTTVKHTADKTTVKPSETLSDVLSTSSDIARIVKAELDKALKAYKPMTVKKACK